MKTGLSLDDVAAVVAEQLRKQKKDLVEHVERRIKLVEITASTPAHETRTANFHRRITQLESAVRRLARERGRERDGDDAH